MGWAFYAPDGVVTGFGTALPSTPLDGDIFIYTDSLTAPTYQWMLRYVAAKAADKWVFIGGSSMINQVATAEARANTAYGALTTAQTLTVPVTGDYMIECGMTITAIGGTQASGAMSYSVGGTASSDVWAAIAVGRVASLSKLGSGHREYKWDNIAATTVITAEFRSPDAADSVTYAGRTLRLTPIAIGG